MLVFRERYRATAPRSIPVSFLRGASFLLLEPHHFPWRTGSWYHVISASRHWPNTLRATPIRSDPGRICRHYWTNKLDRRSSLSRRIRCEDPSNTVRCSPTIPAETQGLDSHSGRCPVERPVAGHPTSRTPSSNETTVVQASGILDPDQASQPYFSNRIASTGGLSDVGLSPLVDCLLLTARTLRQAYMRRRA